MSKLEDRRVLAHVSLNKNMRAAAVAVEAAVKEAQGRPEDITTTKVYHGIFTYHIVNSEGVLILFRRRVRGDEDKEIILAKTAANDPVGDISALFLQMIALER